MIAAELARLRAENARLLQLLKLTPQQATPPGPFQAAYFEAPPGMVHDGSPPDEKVAFYAALLGLEFLWPLFGRGPFQPGDRFKVCFWFGIGLANNFLFGVWWARRHLLRDFREAAAQRYQSGRIGWFGRAALRQDAAPAPETVLTALD